VKLVSECPGVTRSQLTVRIKQSASSKARRSRFMDDVDLVVEIQQQISELPSYGYRRVWGLLRRHEGCIAVKTSNTRWCSDGFEFRCEDGAKLSVTFALDCCDRETR